MDLHGIAGIVVFGVFWLLIILVVFAIDGGEIV